MAKGQEKKGREKKKPKQNKDGQTGHQSEYAKSMAGKSTTPAFGPKK
jgi:hypothetical protein